MSIKDSKSDENMDKLKETAKTYITTYYNSKGEGFILQNSIYEDIMAKL